MKKIISPIPTGIDIIAPTSKSQAIRGIALAMMSLHFCPELSDFKLHNFTSCQDTDAAISIANMLGFSTFYLTPKTLAIKKNRIAIDLGQEPVPLDCSDSALCWHIFSQIAPVFTSNYKMLATDNLKTRIIALQGNAQDLAQPTAEGNTNKYDLNCKNTSQPLTALLLKLPFMKDHTSIKSLNLVSTGYVDLTIEMLAQIGINIDIEYSPKCAKISILGNQKPTSNELFLEGDWSAGAFFFVLGAISGGVNIANLSAQSLQPDRAIVKLFDELKINYEEYAKNIFCIEKSDYRGFSFDATNCPDLIPALVVLAFNASSDSTIYGTERLVNKESNRRDVLLKTFSMFGGRISTIDNGFRIQPSQLSGGFADSEADHRIAMALGIAAKCCKQPITLTRAECVAKSFPAFWDYIK